MYYNEGYFKKLTDDYKTELNKYSITSSIKRLLTIEYITVVIYDLIKSYEPDIINNIDKCIELQNIINIVLICIFLKKKFTLIVNNIYIDVEYSLSIKEKKLLNKYKKKT